MRILTKLVPRTLISAKNATTCLSSGTRFNQIIPENGQSQSFSNFKYNTRPLQGQGQLHGQGLLRKLLSQVQPLLGQRVGVRGYADWTGLSGQERVTFLTDKNIESVIRSSGSLLIMYYAPWCGHCRSSKPEYARAAQMLATERPSAALAAIDCMIYPSIYEKYEITGYPTFKYYNGGRLIGEYHHRRKASDFVHFMLREPKTKADL